MTRFTLFAAAALAGLATPAHAEWTAANPSVAEAAKNPRVAAALEAATRVDTAVVTGDKAAFLGIFTPETRVNNPGNIMSDRVMVDAFSIRARSLMNICVVRSSMPRRAATTRSC